MILGRIGSRMLI